MIKFSLRCDEGHEFEAWFRDSASFEGQRASKEVTCPVCRSAHVEKALMAPGLGAVSVGKDRKKESNQVFQPSDDKAQVKSLIQKLRRHVEENADYVGDKFAEEARRIHFNEAESRGIYGEATAEEAFSLNEEGIEILPLPILPEDQN